MSGAHVKRSRFAHQLSLAALISLSKMAFEEQGGEDSYEEWKKKAINSSPTVLYWFQALELETLLFKFIASLRSGDFPLFVKSLESMLPWMFALDHTHYSRWLPVFLEDLKKLDKNEAIYQNFLQGFFAVSRSNRKFSRMGIDQAHKQNNKIVKVDGGAIGILDDEAALLKWAVAGPIISKMIEDVNCDTEGHHEDTAKLEADFQKKRSSLIQAFIEVRNPFMEHEDHLIHLISKQVMNEVAKDSVINSKDIGNEQLAVFLIERIVGNTSSIYDTIKKNNLPLFRHKNNIVKSNKKKQVVDLVADRRLFSSLYVACQSRKGK